jgi:uncharacterized membrane protein YfcA
VHGVLAAGFLVVAGAVAGVIGTAGGITSLVAYPALLAVGIPPLAANVTSSVALVGSGASSALRAGPDLAGHVPTLRGWLPRSVVLSLAGAVLLVVTPTSLFDRLVPFLVLTGSALLLLQPRISAWESTRGHRLSPLVVGTSAGAVALYNGYFGAGSGILVIALLALTVEPVLRRANAIKNVVIVVSDLLPAALFVALGLVVWRAAVPLGLGAVVGGLIGPSVARRLPEAVLRGFVGCCGVVLAAYLFVRA